MCFLAEIFQQREISRMGSILNYPGRERIRTKGEGRTERRRGGLTLSYYVLLIKPLSKEKSVGREGGTG